MRAFVKSVVSLLLIPQEHQEATAHCLSPVHVYHRDNDCRSVVFLFQSPQYHLRKDDPFPLHSGGFPVGG